MTPDIDSQPCHFCCLYRIVPFSVRHISVFLMPHCSTLCE